MSGCIGPESCSTRGFRVVVGSMLGLLWVFGGISEVFGICWGFWDLLGLVGVV